MTGNLAYLFAGFAVFWAGLFAYLLWLQARLHAVSRELRRLEERIADDERLAQRAAEPLSATSSAAPLAAPSPAERAGARRAADSGAK